MADTETVKQETAENEQPKTFTQEEVNKIIEGRLAKEKAKATSEIAELREKAKKFDELEEASKTELQKAAEKAAKLQTEIDSMKKLDELRAIKEKVAEEMGVPAAVLSGETEEECKAHATAILKFAKPDEYPKVKDAGEANPSNKKNEVDEFSAWFKKSMS